MATHVLEQQFPWARLYSLQRPVQFDALGSVLDEIWAAHSQRRQGSNGSAEENGGGTRLIGNSRATQKIRDLAGRVAPSAATVLISGESGTGKEVVARRIHELSGRKGPFVAINCGAIPDHLLESELFGHERGAFTGAVAARKGRFEIAAGGTLFLDEIGDMPSAMQVKLLRVLQEREIERVGGTRRIPVDIRVIAATHRNLPERVETGRFREDLYYRLSVFPIDIPPLCERREDIPALLDEMAARVQRSHGISVQLADDVVATFCEYSWPGNVRELSNLVERLAVIRPNGIVAVDDLPPPFGPAQKAPQIISSQLQPAAMEVGDSLPDGGLDLKQHLVDVEKRMIESALAKCDGVVQQAARLLGVGRTTLVEKIRRYELRS